MSRKRFALVWLLGGLGTVVVLALVTAVLLKNNGWLGYWRLVAGGAEAVAVVTRIEPQNHCLAEYTYTVDSRSYSGRGPECATTVGERVPITYLISDPTFSCLGSARARLYNELATFIVGGVILPPFIIFAIRRRRRQS